MNPKRIVSCATASAIPGTVPAAAHGMPTAATPYAAPVSKAKYSAFKRDRFAPKIRTLVGGLPKLAA